MSSNYINCPNCGATVRRENDFCDRCGEYWNIPGSGAPRFENNTRALAEELGGILKLYSTGEGYIVWCSGGVIGLDTNGNILWSKNAGYIGNVQFVGNRLYIDSILTNSKTGEPGV